MSPSEKWAILAVRICGLLVAALALWQAVGNVVGSLRDFDPSYVGYYFSTQLARPVCGIALGVILHIFSRPLGRLLARGLDK
jgi:hypothetical protein